MSGCASIAGEKTQPITFKTILDSNEVSGIGCTLTNDAGTWFVTTPGSVTVHKSTGDLSVDCKKDDLNGHDTLVSKSNGAVWGNILAGGGIGYIVDRNTGAGFNYPDTDVVQLHKIPQANSSNAPQPSKDDSPKADTIAANNNSSSVTVSSSENSVEKKLAELKALKDKNLITDEEYGKKKELLLNSF
jgi:hypothetical protein